MSIVYIAMSNKGIVFSADSRLSKNKVIVTDEAQKVFKGRNVIIGAAGFAEADINGVRFNLNKTISSYLSKNPEAPADMAKEFLLAQCGRILAYYPDDRVNLAVGYKDQNGYCIEIFDEGSRQEHHSVYHVLDDVICMGMLDVSVHNVWIPKDMDVDGITKITEMLVDMTIKNAELTGNAELIGGKIHSVTLC